MSITVLLADDHTIVRKGLAALLSAHPGIQVIGEAEDGRQAVQMTRDLSPDVTVMDLSMPNLNGLEATRQIKKENPATNILILTVHAQEQYVQEILKAGASGYLVKKAAPEELIAAIQAVHGGESYLSPCISRMVIDGFIREQPSADLDDPYTTLTPREREILQLVAEGRTTREIARLLHVSGKTVETHRTNLMKKLDLHSRRELTLFAARRGLISLE